MLVVSDRNHFDWRRFMVTAFWANGCSNFTLGFTHTMGRAEKRTIHGTFGDSYRSFCRSRYFSDVNRSGNVDTSRGICERDFVTNVGNVTVYRVLYEASLKNLPS